MSTVEILILSLPTILGNIAALVFRLVGMPRAADVADQITPLALRLGRAAYEKNREQAIGAALDALSVASSELGPDHPVSKAETAIRAHLKSDPPPAPGVPPLPLLVLALVLAGCVPSQLQIAANVANVTAETGSAAAPVLERHCVEPMRAAAAAGDQAKAREVAEVCDPAVSAYESLRVAHVALRSAIVVAASGGSAESIGALLGDVGAAAAQLSESMLKIHGGAK